MGDSDFRPSETPESWNLAWMITSSTWPPMPKLRHATLRVYGGGKGEVATLRPFLTDMSEGVSRSNRSLYKHGALFTHLSNDVERVDRLICFNQTHCCLHRYQHTGTTNTRTANTYTTRCTRKSHHQINNGTAGCTKKLIHQNKRHSHHVLVYADWGYLNRNRASCTINHIMYW